MTYCPCTKQFVLNTAGMVLLVKEVSLKHNIPSDLFVVFDIYKENPSNLDVKPLEMPCRMKKIQSLFETEINRTSLTNLEENVFKSNTFKLNKEKK